MANPARKIDAVKSAESVKTVSSAELLEGALRQGEQSFFPKLSEDIGALIDTVNHQKTQDYFYRKIKKFNHTTRDLRYQVRDIMCETDRMQMDIHFKREQIEKIVIEIGILGESSPCTLSVYQTLSYLKKILRELNDDFNLEKTYDIHEQRIREMVNGIIRELTKTVNPSAVFRRIYTALLTSLFEDLDFLQISLDESKRADKFIRYIEDGDLKPVTKVDRDAAFEEYVRQWKEINQPSYRSYVGRNVEKEIQEMRKEYENAENETELIKKKLIDDMETVLKKAINDFKGVCTPISKTTIVDDIKKKFEPLRHKLQSVREKHNATTLYTAKIVGSFCESGYSRNAVRALDPGWYYRISQRLIQYLTEPESSQSDYNLEYLLLEEKLENDIDHFRECLRNWRNQIFPVLLQLRIQIKDFAPVIKNQLWTFLQDLLNRLCDLKNKSFYLPKDLIMKEAKRMSKFFYALILNDPTMLREHQELLDSMIQDAARTDEGQLPPNCKSSLMPLISFGQLPLAGGSKKRMIRLKFVLDISYSHTKAQEVLQEVCKMFENVRKSEIVEENGVRMINLDIMIQDNIPQYICGLVSKLSDLHIRAVLVGEYGMGIGGSSSGSSGTSGLRRAMNPQYNRIYSVDAVDKADNFISSYFPGFRDKGGEPYFCPNGWRRYGIDVGMTGSEFERKYGDWPVAYHGTKGHLATKILMIGMRASGATDQIRCPNLDKGEGAVFLSPSIEYCGHPYYASVWKVKNKYVQMVLQVRVDRKRIFKRIPGTIAGALENDRAFDRYLEDGKAKFKDNSELEWIVRWPPFTPMTAMDGLVVYGIMLRVTDEHPGRLRQNVWWEESRPGLWDYAVSRKSSHATSATESRNKSTKSTLRPDRTHIASKSGIINKHTTTTMQKGGIHMVTAQPPTLCIKPQLLLPIPPTNYNHMSTRSQPLGLLATNSPRPFCSRIVTTPQSQRNYSTNTLFTTSQPDRNTTINTPQPHRITSQPHRNVTTTTSQLLHKLFSPIYIYFVCYSLLSARHNKAVIVRHGKTPAQRAHPTINRGRR